MARARSRAALKHPYDLDTAIGFWLHLVHHKVRATAERELAPFGVTPEQWAILVRLWQSDEISQAELVGATFRDKPSVSRLLDGLEAAGYVARARNPDDRRSHRIILTARGRALEAKLVPRMRAFIGRWTRDVSPRDLETTVRTLRALYAALDPAAAREKVVDAT
ncbi:MAG TPA: MarR family transcriptional regulator [Kofleriaceae bacterium]|nr:MarR family transcriptional regulator [Kofleriaceae bacterium]